MRSIIFLALLCGCFPFPTGAQTQPGPGCDAEAAYHQWFAAPCGPTFIDPPAFVDALASEDATGFVGPVQLSGRIDAGGGSRTRWRAGAVAGFVIGSGVTFLVLRSGGSTALCDRSANQDAIGARECAGLALAGGVVGAGVGALIGSQVRAGR